VSLPALPRANRRCYRRAPTIEGGTTTHQRVPPEWSWPGKEETGDFVAR